MKETFEIRDMRNGDWHWVYNAVSADPHLTPAEKLIYSSLSTFGGCEVIRPSMKTIGERSSLSERTARQAVKRLQEVGYISFDSGGGRHQTNKYLLLKRPKGCKFCLVSKVGKVEQETRQTTTLKGADSAPQLYKELDKKKISLVPSGIPGVTLNLLIEKFKEVNPSYETLFPNKSQRAALERMVAKHGQEKVERLIQWISKTNKMPYSPTITTPVELEVKLGQLLAFISKEKLKADQGKISVSVRTTKDEN